MTESAGPPRSSRFYRYPTPSNPAVIILLSPMDDPLPNSHPFANELYDELRSMALKVLQKHGHSVEPTVLLHEAWLRLAERTEGDFKSRTHFMAAAARVMRHVLVDVARDRSAQKRGGDRSRVTLTGQHLDSKHSTVDVIELVDALEEFGRLDPRACQVVELRFFGGLNNDEIAGELGVSERTVRNDWTMARAWLRRELSLDA